METKRIVRSQTDRVVAGVASGLASYFNIDPLFVRIGFVLLSLLQGFGVILYFVLWLLLPTATSLTADSRDQVRENVNDMRSTAEAFGERIKRMFNA